jgi:hypothetical protein
MKQPEGQAFSKFLLRLEKEFADAGALNWLDEAKRQILLGSLNRTMSGSLMNRGVPATFQGLISRLHDITTDMDALNLSKPSGRRTIKDADEMDWTPSAVTANRVESSTNRLRNDIEARKRAKWVSEEEMSRRREEGRCLRCGRAGCRIAQCPYLPAERPELNRVTAGQAKQGQSAGSKKTYVRKARPIAEDTDGSSDEESLVATESSDSENE